VPTQEADRQTDCSEVRDNSVTTPGKGCDDGNTNTWFQVGESNTKFSAESRIFIPFTKGFG